METLSLLHRVAGFAFAFFSLCGLLPLTTGLPVVLGIVSERAGTGEPRSVGEILVLMGAGVVLMFAALALGAFQSTGWIRRRESRGLVIAMECVLLLFLPLGTALGIYGLVLLSKPHVKAAFRS